MLAETLQNLRRENNSLYTIESLRTSFDLAATAYQISFDEDDDQSSTHYFFALTKLISLMAELLPTDVTIESLRHIVSQNGRCVVFGSTLFHIACCIHLPADNLLAVIKLLLKYKADPHIVDKIGRGTLHCLALGEPNRRDIEAAARLLLDMENGLHLDQADYARRTATDYYKENHPEAGNLPDWLRMVPKLVCLNARVIKSHNIPYQYPDLPATLVSFVKKH